jgi:signal peptidase II
VLVADQLTKRWVDASFGLAWTRGPIPGLDPPTPILDDLVRIAKTYNDGGLFGLFGTSAPILALASLIVIGLILAYEARVGAPGSWLLTVTLGLLLGGALGNLADRIRLGHVIDWVDTGLGSTRWYTFNVADAAVSLAIVGLVLVALLGDRSVDGAPARDSSAAGPASR